MIAWKGHKGYEILDDFLTDEEYTHYYNVCKGVYENVLESPNHKN